MPLFARLLTLFVALAILTGCDDDDGDKKPKYEIEILVSDNINWVITEMKPQGRFKKPLVEVHHPEGVDTKHVERKPKKTTVYEFSRPNAALASWTIVLLAGIWLALRQRPQVCSFLPFSSPTYQRG